MSSKSCIWFAVALTGAGALAACAEPALDTTDQGARTRSNARVDAGEDAADVAEEAEDTAQLPDAGAEPQDAGAPDLGEGSGPDTTDGAIAPVVAVDAAVAQPVCAPAARQCLNTSTYSLCADDGGGLTQAQCPSEAPLCVGSGTCVACTKSACAGPASLRRCENGAWQAVECGAQRACVELPEGAACTGSCMPGAQRCRAPGDAVERCSATGAWQQEAACAQPLQSCSVLAGAAACRDNGTFTLGAVDPFRESEWTAWSVPNDQVYLVPVEVPVKSVLSSFVLRAAVNQGSCTMALYDDDAGKPGNLLAESFTVTYVQQGRVVLEPNGEIPLAAGAKLWVGGECFLAPGGAQLYTRAAQAAYFHFAEPAAGSYPNHPVGTLAQGAAFSFGITVRRVP